MIDLCNKIEWNGFSLLVFFLAPLFQSSLVGGGFADSLSLSRRFSNEQKHEENEYQLNGFKRPRTCTTQTSVKWNEIKKTFMILWFSSRCCCVSGFLHVPLASQKNHDSVAQWLCLFVCSIRLMVYDNALWLKVHYFSMAEIPSHGMSSHQWNCRDSIFFGVYWIAFVDDGA